MHDIKLIRVFLACPGDVAPEAGVVKEVIESLNIATASTHGVRFELINWRTHSYPSYGGEPQAILNEQIADMSNVDLFVGIMWNRFGTPTSAAESGTKEEFDRAAESFRTRGQPQIMFFFNQAPSNLGSLEQVEQRGKVIAFRDKLLHHGLIQDYDGPDDFKDLFRKAVELWLVRQGPRHLEPPRVESHVETVVTTTRTEPDAFDSTVNNSGNWVLLNDSFYLATRVDEEGDGTVSMSILVRGAEDDAAFRSLSSGNVQGLGTPIAFAYQNSAAVARIKEIKRSSSAGSDSWTLQLKVESNESHFLAEMWMGSLSADQIAVMRARLMLLGEDPSLALGGNTMNAMMLWALVEGSEGAARQTLLPALWQSFGHDEQRFLPLARLWCVFHLVTTRTCEFILELVIGPIKNERVHIKFRGRRHRVYANVDPFEIQVEGECNLKT